MNDQLAQLPVEQADRLTRPLMRFLRIEAVAGVALLLSTIAALLVSNSPWSAQYFGLLDMHAGFRLGGTEFSRSLKHWINDALMTLFFFTLALELKRELTLGELRDRRAAALPVAAALGGMVVPAVLFLLLVDGGAAARGWGTVMSTDTAFVVGCLAVLGARVQQSLRLFLVSLAIFDDIGAILVIAIAYGDPLNWNALWLAGLGLAIIAGIGRLGVRGVTAYFVVGGGVWLAVDASGVHATLTGVLLGLMTPARAWVSDRRLHAIFDRVKAWPPGDHWSGDRVARSDLQQAGVAAREAFSPVERLEFALHPWVAFVVMPLFAFANAGVSMETVDLHGTLVTAVLVAFVVGKPVGVVSFGLVAVKLGLARLPGELSWRMIAAGSLLTGIGFTLALFIAEQAFDPDLLDSVKVGVLGASVISAVAGMALVWLFSPTQRMWR